MFLIELTSPPPPFFFSHPPPSSPSTQIPYRGNKHSLSDPLEIQLQAVLEHGQYLTVFRSFGNFSKTANLAIHCFLLQLERRLMDPAFNNKLANTIFLQVDGGGENRLFPILGALLVARGLCDTFILTRLPVGHTHEDIDARFLLSPLPYHPLNSPQLPLHPSPPLLLLSPPPPTR